MKRLQKATSLLLSLTLALGLAACGGDPSASPSPSPSESAAPSAEPTATQDAAGKVALLTGQGDIHDQSYNQSAWEGVQSYCDKNGKDYKNYKASEATRESCAQILDAAVADGAKFVIAPGDIFQLAVFDAQSKYPDVTFLLLDAAPQSDDGTVKETRRNTVSVSFAEEQAGFLAGYAAVKDGGVKLGFMGGQPVAPVIRYGYGFIQGANAAAGELGETVQLLYYYADSFDAQPAIQELASGWYGTGTQTIFACGGAMGSSVMEAAEKTGGRVIGVDTDQSGASETVVTSALKGVEQTVVNMLDAHYTDQFPGGQNLRLTAADDGVGLAMDTARWSAFTQADYEAVYNRLAAGSVPLQTDVDAMGPTDVTAPNVDVQFIQG